LSIDLSYLLINVSAFLFISNVNLVSFFIDSWLTIHPFIFYFFPDTLFLDKIFNFSLLTSLSYNDVIYCIYFDTKVVGNNNVFFYVLQNKLFILPGETTLSFFRVYNDNIFPITGITIYSITPIDFQSFLNKIQCFCFEEIIIYSFETVELPVLFYLDTNISYLNSISINEFCIEYVLLCKKVI
jgi:cytochrome c oxidase assembly protein subunit 11